MNDKNTWFGTSYFKEIKPRIYYIGFVLINCDSLFRHNFFCPTSFMTFWTF